MKAIQQMLAVLKPGCYLVLEHRINEAINNRYAGLHQWNFRANEDNDFIISSKYIEVNISEQYRNVHKISVEATEDNWLIVTTLKYSTNAP
jgi:hypothetical protein